MSGQRNSLVIFILAVCAVLLSSCEFQSVTVLKPRVPNSSTLNPTPSPIASPTPSPTSSPSPTPQANLPPSAPSNLVATTNSSSQITLNWIDNSTNETQFKIERSLDGIAFSQIAIVTTNMTSYDATGLSPNTVYFFRVRASNFVGDSIYSNVASTKTLVYNPPPLASNGSLSTVYKMPAVGKLSAVDSNNDPLTYSLVSSPTKGQIQNLNMMTGDFTYQPSVGFDGADSFTFRASDGSAFSNTATFSITITPKTGLTYKVDIKPFTDARCVSCHAPGNPAGGYTFDTYAQPGKDTVLRWDRAVVRISDDTMPPSNPKATAEEKLYMKWWKAQGYPSGETGGPPPGGGLISCDQSLSSFPLVRVRRLTNQQYDNSIVDLFGYTGALGKGFDPQEEINGFFTHASVHVSVARAQQYAQAAATVSNTVVLSSLSSCANSDSNCIQNSFIPNVGKKIYGQPLSSAQITGLMNVYNVGKIISAEAGVRAILEAMLQSPYFIYRLELGDPNAPVGSNTRLTSYEVAKLLSYTILQSVPDTALTNAANTNALQTPTQILSEANRLLNLAKGKNLGVDYLQQLVSLHKIFSASKQDPAFTSSLMNDMAQETKLFIDDAITTNKTLAHLLTSPYTFVNDKVGVLYGLNVTGGFQKVFLDPTKRSGITTQPSFAAVFSRSDTKSPVRRGRFVRERLLCQEVSAPPPNVPTDPPPPGSGQTNRDTFEAHSSNPTCYACHQSMDPIGFGYENFDTLGRYSTNEPGGPIDVSGEIIAPPVGPNITFNGPVQLTQILALNESVNECGAVEFYRYGMGYKESAADGCFLSSVYNSFKGTKTFRDLFIGLIQNDVFVTRKK